MTWLGRFGTIALLANIGCDGRGGPVSPSGPTFGSTWRGEILVDGMPATVVMDVAESSLGVAPQPRDDSATSTRLSGAYSMSGGLGEATGMLGGNRYGSSVLIQLSLGPRDCSGANQSGGSVALFLTWQGDNLSGDARIATCASAVLGTATFRR